MLETPLSYKKFDSAKLALRLHLKVRAFGFAKKISTHCLNACLKLALSMVVFFVSKNLQAHHCTARTAEKFIYMTVPTIKTYKAANELPAHYFFILNKGNNSGRPSDRPNVNCFIAICEDDNHREQFFWISYALWQGKHFERELIGSVIPFIRKQNVEKLLARGFEAAQERNEHYRKAVIKMRNFQRFKTDAESLLKQQMQAHRAMLHNILFVQNLSFKNH